MMTTPIEDFPNGFGNPKEVFSPIFEATHTYKAKGLEEYHMFYEVRSRDGIRHFGLAVAEHPGGPWVIRDDRWAAGEHLKYDPGVTKWTEEVSHGELLRTGYDQKLEYDPENPKILIQGLCLDYYRKHLKEKKSYSEIIWTLGLIEKENPGL